MKQFSFFSLATSTPLPNMVKSTEISRNSATLLVCSLFTFISLLRILENVFCVCARHLHQPTPTTCFI